ncbi:hypothetical protein [Aliiroseovarius sp.]|uniref:LIC10280 family protein n=1 Tax=Aliiroseovarius sp. TaxID=1872442 RepID=UPI002638F5D6|nr:hypothetical protein [Aliiroseovarius sp.]
MLRRVFLTLTPTLVALTLVALPAVAQSIAGNYTAFGMNPDGSKYTGSVVINEGSNGKVSMSWQVGAQRYEGSGQRVDRVVTVHWGAATPVVYVTMPGGELHGTWNGGEALERLVRR